MAAASYFRWLNLFPALATLTLAVWVASSVATPAHAADSQPTNEPAITLTTPVNASPDASTNVDVLDNKYRLTIGDQLSFKIVEDEEEPKIVSVMDSGELQVPYLGRYPAAGKTCKELALGLKAELEKKYYYRATVIVAVNSMPKSRGKIYLVGAVRAPGPQDIAADEALTLSKAILRSGGFTDFANQKKVKVTRTTASDGKKTFVVDVERVLEKGETESDLPLLPGDLIFIPERMIRF